MVFQRNGLYAAQYNICFLTKAQEAKGKGQKPSKIIEKISWEDYQDENPTQAKSVIIAHPPPKNPRHTTKYARTNYYSQRERFVKWLRTGSGESLYIHIFLTSSFESNLSLTLSHLSQVTKRNLLTTFIWLSLDWVTAKAIIKEVVILQV
jgi:hypothetical protein